MDVVTLGMAKADAANKYAVLAPAAGSSAFGDAALIQAVHDALPAAGGTIRLRAGLYNLNGVKVTFSKPVALVGAGGGFVDDASVVPGKSITTIYQNSATVGALLFTAAGSTVSDLSVVNNSSTDPTAGIGVEFTKGFACDMTRVTVAGFYDCVTLQGWYSNFTGVRIYDPVNYGLHLYSSLAYLNDHLDFGMVNCVISMVSTLRTPAAAIRWEGGGGFRMTGCKLNGRGQPGSPGTGGSAGSFAIGLDVYFTVTSIDLNVQGNSIANTRVACIRVTTNGTGSIATGIISNNLFDSVISGVGIAVGSSGSTDLVRGMSIVDNTFQWFTGATVGVLVYCSRGVHIGENLWTLGAPTVALIQLAPSTMPTGLPVTPDTGQQTLGASVDRQIVTTLDALDIVQDQRTFGSSTNLFDGAVEYDYTKQVAISATATPVTLFYIELDTASGSKGEAVLVDFELVGQNSNAGHSSANNKGVAIRQTRAIETTNTGTVTVTTVGTDIVGGAGGAYLTVTYTTASNRTTITVQTNDATQVLFQGQARLRVRGKLSKFHKGP
jgi:hypothetical protein